MNAVVQVVVVVLLILVQVAQETVVGLHRILAVRLALLIIPVHQEQLGAVAQGRRLTIVAVQLHRVVTLRQILLVLLLPTVLLALLRLVVTLLLHQVVAVLGAVILVAVLPEHHLVVPLVVAVLEGKY